MYIDSVTISNLRCFEHQTVPFVNPGARPTGPLNNVTLLLGNNGVGKTTVLRAISLATLNQALTQAGYVPYSMIRRSPGARSGQAEVLAEVLAEIRLHDQDLEGRLTTSDLATATSSFVVIVPRGDTEHILPGDIHSEGSNAGSLFADERFERQLFDDRSPGILVLGYGATRRVDPASEFSPGRRRKQRLLRYERVSSLFEEQVSLAPLAGWLPELQREKPKLFGRVCELLGQLIPSDTRFTGKLDGDEYLFERGGIEVGFAALSDGYRGYIGLLSDLFYHLCTGLKDEDEPTLSRGIVLIDEIGLHLHPAWQRVVVPTLARTLPRLQFVLTTHSPIIAGTAYADNIRLLEADEQGRSHLEPLDAEIHGLNADQILLTDAFGLSSSRAPDFAKRLGELERELDADNWQDALRLMRMLNHGSAGDRAPEPAEPPAWAYKAARELAERLGAKEEDLDVPARKSAKKPVAKKTTAKKTTKAPAKPLAAKRMAGKKPSIKKSRP